MEDLPEALVTEILKRITRTSDLNSLSLVSKQLYKIEGNQRGAIRVGSGLCTATEALASLCARFPNLRKVEIDYSGWIPGHGNQLDNKDLTLSFCAYIDDSGLGCLAYCKKLVSLRLNSMPQITSVGLFSVAVGCMSLSALHLIDCEKIDSVEWLEYLGKDGLLEELVVKNCKGINHHDFLKFGSGWMKLQKFEFESKRDIYDCLAGDVVYDSSYDAHSTDIYNFCCESLKDLRLAHIKTWPEVGLRVVLGKCKAWLIICEAVTDAGMRFIAHTPCLSNLTLRLCHEVTDVGVAELRHAHKLESLVIECCSKVSLEAAHGVAKLVHYSRNYSDALKKTIGLSAY